ncbi:MAG: hypothetical protein K2N91_03840 [Muribaculaceae bacterium]|nr:hypothetical protein [Muribaculaceae bacterium]
MKFRKYLTYAAAALTAVSFASCSDDNDDPKPVICPAANPGLFIVNNGNYGTPNASLSFYDLTTNTINNNVFATANGIPLGEVAQSVTIDGNSAFIAVNLSNKVYAINANNYEIEAEITDHVSSPRYFVKISDDKYYLSQMNNRRIGVYEKEMSGYKYVKDIEVSSATGGNEYIIVAGNYAYTNAWSYGKTLAKIDIINDKVEDQLEVGVQPESIAYCETSNSLWVLCDGGGWEQNPIGYEAPSLVEIDLASFTKKQTITLPMGSTSKLCYHEGALYWLTAGKGVTKMDLASKTISDHISIASYGIYALTISPANGDIYVADALDYTQNGVVYSYDLAGNKIGDFKVGIIPAGFAWKF